jgi:hypothetical protein
MVRLQNSILKCLHHHIIFSMFFDIIFKAHYAQILSCYSFRANTWLIVWLVFQSFWLSSPILFTAFQTQLWLPHPSITTLLPCVCTHPIDLMNIHLLCCTHGNGCTRTHDTICDPLLPLHKMLTFIWHENNYSTSFNYVQLLLLINQQCAHQKWNSYLVDIVIANPTHINLFH